MKNNNKEMEKYKIQLDVSKDDFDDIQERADKSGLLLSMYVRKLLFPKDEIVKQYEHIMNKLLKLAEETNYQSFDVPQLFGDDWDKKVPQNFKGILGKNFYLLVEKKYPGLEGIKATQKVNKGTTTRMVYKKKI